MSLAVMAKRQERSKLIAEAKSILDRADNEKRNVTTAEQERVEDLQKRAQGMTREITLMENQHELESDQNRSMDDQRLETEMHGTRNSNTRSEDIRAYRHGQSIAPEVRTQLPDNAKPSEWSLRRALRGVLLQKWDGAELEHRTMVEGAAGSGGVFVPEAVSASIIDRARNVSALSNAGMQTFVMQSPKVVIGKVLTDPSPGWRGEGAAITESEGSFGGVTLEAKTVAILTSASVEVLEDASGFAQTIEDQIASAIGLEIDRVGLFGNGVQEPRGIYYTSGVQERSLGTNGAELDGYDDVSSAVEDLLEVNANPTVAIWSPRTWGTFDRMKDGDGLPLRFPASYEGLRKIVSNQIPNTLTQGSSSVASAAFLGGFNNVLMGIRTNLTIEASRVAGSTAFANMKVMIRGYARLDYAIARENHLLKITGILAA